MVPRITQLHAPPSYMLCETSTKKQRMTKYLRPLYLHSSARARSLLANSSTKPPTGARWCPAVSSMATTRARMRQRHTTSARLAEGEELGSNLLQVLHRRPTELGGLGKVARAAQPSPGCQGCETAILPRGG